MTLDSDELVHDLLESLGQRLPLHAGIKLGSLASEISVALLRPGVLEYNAANYMSWCGQSEQDTAIRPRGLFWPLRKLIGPTPAGLVRQISDAAWAAILADCAVYAERAAAEFPLDVAAAIAAIPGVDDDQADELSHRVWAASTTATSDCLESKSDELAVFNWAAGWCISGIANDTVLAPDALEFLDEESFWRGDTTASPSMHIPDWQPVGDGLETLRIHPTVAATITNWFRTNWPTETGSTTATDSDIAAHVSEFITTIDAATCRLGKAYRAAYTSSPPITPAVQLWPFIRLWLTLVALCLSVTAVTAELTWQNWGGWITEQTGWPSFYWVAGSIFKSVGLTVVLSALSVLAGLLWVRRVKTLRYEAVKTAIGYAIAFTAGVVAPIAAWFFVVVKPSEYLPVSDWWEGGFAGWVACLPVTMLVLYCYMCAMHLVKHWKAEYNRPATMAAAITDAQFAVVHVWSATGKMVAAGVPLEHLEMVRVRLIHLEDLLDALYHTSTMELLYPEGWPKPTPTR